MAKDDHRSTLGKVAAIVVVAVLPILMIAAIVLMLWADYRCFNSGNC